MKTGRNAQGVLCPVGSCGLRRLSSKELSIIIEMSFEEEMVLEVIGMLVRSGRICERNIWAGFSEIPMSIGELLSENDGHWRQRLRDLEHEQMSNAERVLIAKEFLYKLTELALSDRYFESLQQKDS